MKNNYTIRELTAEIFNWKNKFNDLKYKYDKGQEKKKMLKQYLKEKVESLVEAEESLSNANDIIQDLSSKNEKLSLDQGEIENYYQKDFETIVNTLSSMKVYDQDTIESDSLIEVINRSLKEIQEENKEVKILKQKNLRLLEIEQKYDILKQEFYTLNLKLKEVQNDNSSKKFNKQLMILIKSKTEAYKSELEFMKSSFKSELSILKSSTETLFNNVLLKSKEIIMNNEFEKEDQMMRYKNRMINQYGINVKR